MNETAFLQAILDHPTDDSLRLVYADWLEERCDNHRAEYLRLTVAVTQNNDEVERYYQRLGELRSQIDALWLESIDRIIAEDAVRNYFRSLGRTDLSAYTIHSHEVPGEGWVVTLQPTNSYLRRNHPERRRSLFVDHKNRRVHTIPSSGLKHLIADLRDTL